MTQQRTRVPKIAAPILPLPGGDQTGARWLIAAVLAAGNDGCTCNACQLLKKFGGEMSSAMLKETADGGD